VTKEKAVQTLQEKGYPHTWLFATFWTIIIVISLSWNIARQKNEIIEVATNEAKTIFEKDQVYYRWATSHKGVYVPLTDKTLSNPYLDHLPESTGTTATGLTLTLVNPEYMIRQVYEMSTGSNSPLGHITSLDPIRQENAADSWESKALAAFEKGETQVSSVETIDGQPYLRLMRPMMTEGGCLKCHEQQGYALGDIRGGISVAVPMSLLFSIYRRDLVLVARVSDELAPGIVCRAITAGLLDQVFSAGAVTESERGTR